MGLKVTAQRTFVRRCIVVWEYLEGAEGAETCQIDPACIDKALWVVQEPDPHGVNATIHRRACATHCPPGVAYKGYADTHPQDQVRII